MEKTVNFCGNCPFCVYDYDDFAVGDMISYRCNLSYFLELKEQFLENNESTPEWCPLKKEDFSFKYKKFSDERLKDIKSTKKQIDKLELLIDSIEDYDSEDFKEKSKNLDELYVKIDQLYSSEDSDFFEDFQNDLTQKIEEIKEQLASLEDVGIKLQETFSKLDKDL